ncbi:MAG: C1 family peptidase [Marinilabiliaceae bacterium]|jgi:bleomycin hydrolase|nr:C1 family peptidase [Marinilabiliaceae bacterium]
MKFKVLIAVLLSVSLLNVNAQNKKKKTTEEEGYIFTTEISLPATSVKNQARTGTCWCFATTSFMESELLRMNKGEFDLSEMFIVRQNYIDRLNDNYLRRGKGNVSQGSLAHDWLRVFSNQGIVPEEVYNGINYGGTSHNHGEMLGFIEAISEVPVKLKNQSDQYHMIVDHVLDTYLGEVPENFTYKGKNYTPKSFAADLGINPDDYVEITSFNHFPFYTKGTLEVPDNWTHDKFYNVPVDELIEIMDYALENGYTVNWDGDVSEKGFSHANGVAINPDIMKTEDFSGTDRARFEDMTPAKRLEEVYKFSQPFPEINVSQDLRQEGYEAFVTTDDHLMHVTGRVKDQNGTKYYITKNSWGTGRNKFDGYLNMSESYIKAKVIFIMVHKDAVPDDIRTKLGF